MARNGELSGGEGEREKRECRSFAPFSFSSSSLFSGLLLTSRSAIPTESEHLEQAKISTGIRSNQDNKRTNCHYVFLGLTGFFFLSVLYQFRLVPILLEFASMFLAMEDLELAMGTFLLYYSTCVP